MHDLHMDLSTSTSLAASTSFLRRVHPLRWTPPRKKSEMRHAVAELVTKVLSNLVGRALAADNGAAIRG
eukprot:1093451-Prorocentrum_minimum.AAC.1